jgi:hypothetical protein
MGVKRPGEAVNASSLHQMKPNHDSDRLQAWAELSRSRPLSTVSPRKNTAVLSNGFVCANKGDGMTSWIPTPLRVSSISFLTKRKANPPRAFFVSGRRKRDIRRYPAVLGTVSGIASSSSKSRRQELSSMAAGSSSPLAPFPALAGKRRSLQPSGWRSPSRPRQASGRKDDLGLDRHPLRLRPAGGLLSVKSRLRFPHP